jgi:hypothetical protein
MKVSSLGEMTGRFQAGKLHGQGPLLSYMLQVTAADLSGGV